jgi:hypothetical protein
MKEFGGHDEHGENPLDMIKKELLSRYPDGRMADGTEVTIPVIVEDIIMMISEHVHDVA